jgi:transmembrane sensor
MNGDENAILVEAAAWHAASGRDDMDWDGFTAWLEANPRHRTAYDEVALTDAVLEEHREPLRLAAEAADAPAPRDEPAPLRPIEAANDGEAAPATVFSGWKRWAGGAIAASLVAVLAVPQLFQPAPVVYETHDTAQAVALTDGSTVMLAPHSRLTVAGRAQDRMALAGGAWFDIRHDPARPLAITAGGVEISDIGTKFDVQTGDAGVRVKVADGEVKVSADALAGPIRLSRGRSLLFDGADGTALVTSVTADSIGEWRSGRLSYVSMPLALVAADLSRYAGVKVTMADELRGRQFSGTLVIGDGEAALRDLSQVLGLALDRDSGGYRLRQR